MNTILFGGRLMLFADNSQRMHSVIGRDMAIPDFVLNVLRNIIRDPEPKDEFDHIKKIRNIFKDTKGAFNESTLKSYYYGKAETINGTKEIVEDKINNLSKTISPYLNAEKFMQYLVKLKFNFKAKNDLCASFKEAVPDINIDNYADKL